MKQTLPVVNIVGGGLAGSEAAYQLGIRGIKVRLYEMRPNKLTPAHTGGGLAELVCSNSFKSTGAHAAHGGFKRELAAMGSLLMTAAPAARVPAGDALAVDREAFSKEVEKRVLDTNFVERIPLEVNSLSDLPDAFTTILATGPLTQGGLAQYVADVSGKSGLYFYDAIAPVISKDSINQEVAFTASRYGKGGDDYLNCPMTKDEYECFYNALISAEKMDFQDFEQAKYFQGCQPIEAIAATGKDSLRFGAMKPVGLEDPRTGRRPYAAVQLRIDNLSHSAYNMVGFQTKLKYNEQAKVFKLIPGLENAEFLRLGSMHRNTYVCSPIMLNKNFSIKSDPSVRLAGQITGVEGYTESSAVGLLCALSVASEIKNLEFTLPPADTFTGALCRYLFDSDADGFQPVNVHYGLFSEDCFTKQVSGLNTKKIGKNEKRTLMAQAALENFNNWRVEQKILS